MTPMPQMTVQLLALDEQFEWVEVSAEEYGSYPNRAAVRVHPNLGIRMDLQVTNLRPGDVYSLLDRIQGDPD